MAGPTRAQLEAEPWWNEEIVSVPLRWCAAELCRRGGRPAQAAGTKGNEQHLSGGHRSQDWILNSRYCESRTYTVQPGLTALQRRHIAALDYAPGDWGTAENRRRMIAMSRRTIDAMKAGRLDEVRQYFGTLDGVTVTGWDNVNNRVISADATHLDHGHWTFDRRQLLNQDLMERVVVIALGEDYEVVTDEDVRRIAQGNWELFRAPLGPDGTAYNMQDHVIKAEFGVADLGTKVNALMAAAAADKTRDDATLAAINALANAGGVDAAPIIAAIEAEGEASRALMADQHQAEMASLNELHAQQLSAKDAEIAGLQAELAALSG